MSYSFRYHLQVIAGPHSWEEDFASLYLLQKREKELIASQKKEAKPSEKKKKAKKG